MKQKYFPKINEELYLRQGGRSKGYVALVRHPYTVIKVDDKEVLVQACTMEWNNGHYYDSFPTNIIANPKGKVVVLHWSDTIHGGCWWAYKDSTCRDYPLIACFGKYDYYPYLD